MIIFRLLFHPIALILSLLPLSLSILISKAFALPVDITGDFAAETLSWGNYRKINETSTSSADSNFIADPATGSGKNASFQSYILKLRPSIIVNDSVTLRSEFSTGYGFGGQFGDSSDQRQNGDTSFGQALYFYNTSSEQSNFNIRKFYAELFSDTGTYTIGRQSSEWGLGLIYNSGDETFDRHSTIRDGISIQYQIGNFHISPYWFKIDLTSGSDNGSLTREQNAKEYGISLLYKNPEKEMSFGLLFGKKRSKSQGSFFRSDVTDINNSSDTLRSLGETDVKITDLFFKKSFGDFSIAAEVPIVDGDLGDVFATNQNSEYKANAIVLESEYKMSDSWTFGLDGGMVKGDDGDQDAFEAMYLHPNYQIAQVMFRYNADGVRDPSSESVFDSSLTNALYAKLRARYQSGQWTWKMAWIWAKAREVAKNGSNAFNHEKNKLFSATADQDDSYGQEFDFEAIYQWNYNVKIIGHFGYFFVGDFYAYNGSNEALSLEDPYAIGLQTAISF